MVFNEASKWLNAIILYVSGEELTIKYLRGFIERQWPWVSNREIYYHEEGYIIIRYKTNVEKNDALAS